MKITLLRQKVVTFGGKRNPNHNNNYADSAQKEEILDLSAQIVKKSQNAYYKQNKYSQNFLLDFQANFIGIKNGRWITKEYLKMKKILQAISCKF